VTEFGEGGGEPLHAVVEEGEVLDGTGVGNNVVCREWRGFDRGEEELDFFVDLSRACCTIGCMLVLKQV